MATDPASGGMAETWSLQTELARIQDAVRREPAKAAHRSGVGCSSIALRVHGTRLSRQLALLADLDPEAQLFCTQGRLLLACEAERTEVLGGPHRPVLPGRAP